MKELLMPMFGMMSLTFILMPLTAWARVRAVRSRQIKIKNFELMDLNEAPELVRKTTRHWSNLYEVPTVFYALVLVALVMNIQDSWIAYAAWLYVGLRVVHATIHITYNKVFHRFLAFAASNLTLLFIFFRVILNTI